MNIRLQVFKGMAPMLDEGLLRNEQAILARDVDLRRGSMRSLCRAAESGAVPDNARTIYRWRGAERWICAQTVAHFVESQLADDAFQRLYSSGESGGKMRLRYAIGGEEKTVDLGIEAPAEAPTVRASEKTSTTWSRKWGWYWEETGGTLVGAKRFFEDENGAWNGLVTSSAPGKTYLIPETIVAAVLAQKPAEASETAFCSFFFEAWSASGAILGRVHPDRSTVSADNDLFINGFKVSMSAKTAGGSVTATLAYDMADVEENTTDRVYVFTYVDELGEESAPSPASVMLSVRPDMDVAVDFLTHAQPDNRAAVAKRRLYRTVTSSSSTEYQFVADVPMSQSQFIDALTDMEVGETMPSAGWDPPPDGLAGLVAVPGGFMAAYKEKTVYFSETAAPHAWPIKYAVSCDSLIRGLAVVGNGIYVLTDEYPELITTSGPASAERAIVPFAQSCTGARTIQTSSGGVLYASPDGICQMVGMLVVVLSQAYLSKEKWREMQTDGSGAFRPEETSFAVYDDLLYVFAAGGSWTWDVVKPDRGLVELTQRAEAARYVPADDALYVAASGKMFKLFGAEGETLSATWRSKRFAFPRPIRFRRARITAEGPARLVLRDGAGREVYAIDRMDSTSFLLPPLAPCRFWIIELVSQAAITEFSIGTSSAEM